MPLPVLSAAQAATSADLLRYMGHVQVGWSQHLAEELALPGGRVFAQPQLLEVDDANCVLGAVAESMAAAEALLSEVDARYRQAGSRCRRWVLAPSAESAPLTRVLMDRGYVPAPQMVMRLSRHPQAEPAVAAAQDLKIIPARAGYRHLHMLAAEDAAETGNRGAEEATLLHLDDGHYDALLALSAAAPVAFAGVLHQGEVAAIQQLFVSVAHRRRGLGGLLVDRALELCARAQSRHILAAIDAGNSAARALLQRGGFEAIGTLEVYSHR